MADAGSLDQTLSPPRHCLAREGAVMPAPAGTDLYNQ
jgi:hypothetical protein